jgi:hypothetical protein
MTEQVTPQQDPLDNEVLKFEFTVAQTNAILNILGNAPYIAAAPLITLVQSQGTPQFAELLKKVEPAAEEAKAE